MDEEMIVCLTCGEQTSKPPDEVPQWLGYCPDCVIRRYVFPLIDKNLQDLLDAMMNQRQSACTGIVLAVPASMIEGEHAAEKLSRDLITNPDFRRKMLEILNEIETNVTDEDIKKHLRAEKPKGPVVHNNPRWS